MLSFTTQWYEGKWNTYHCFRWLYNQPLEKEENEHEKWDLSEMRLYGDHDQREDPRSRGRFNRDNPLKVIVEEPAPVEKGQFWMSDSVSGHVRAWICSQCGFTEFYADNLENLYKAYKRYRLNK